MTGRSDGPPVLGIDLGGTKILAGVVGADHRILGSRQANDARPGRGAGDPGCGGRAASMRPWRAAGLYAQRGRRGRHRLARSTRRQGGRHPLQRQSERQELPDRPRAARRHWAGRSWCTTMCASAVTPNTAWEPGRGYRDVIVAFVGTGIGGCVIQRGEIVAGATGNAGEIGHMIVKAGGPRCGCGAGVASKLWPARPPSRGASTRPFARGCRPCSAKRWPAREAGSRAATSPRPSRPRTWSPSRKSSGRPTILGIGLGSLINVIGPEIVIIGGGVAGALADSYIELVRGSARRRPSPIPRARSASSRRPGRRRRHSGRGPAGPRTSLAVVRHRLRWNRRSLCVGWAPPTGSTLGGRCPPYKKPSVRCAEASTGLISLASTSQRPNERHPEAWAKDESPDGCREHELCSRCAPSEHTESDSASSGRERAERICTAGTPPTKVSGYGDLAAQITIGLGSPVPPLTTTASMCFASVSVAMASD